MRKIAPEKWEIGQVSREPSPPWWPLRTTKISPSRFITVTRCDLCGRVILSGQAESMKILPNAAKTDVFTFHATCYKAFIKYRGAA